MTYYVSKERLGELEKEYNELITTRRMEVAERLRRAKEYGDLSENSEYNEAKDEQAQLERRIHEVEDILKNSEVIKKDNNASVASIGSEVIVKKAGKEFTYTIVGSQEADPDQGKISNESPVGSALLGHAAGENVTVETLSGKVIYTIVAIK